MDDIQSRLDRAINAQAELHAELVCIATDAIKENRDKIDTSRVKLNSYWDSEHDNIKSIKFNDDDDIYIIMYSGNIVYSLDDFNDDELIDISNYFIN